MSLTDEDKQWLERSLADTAERIIAAMRGIRTELLLGLDIQRRHEGLEERVRKLEGGEK
jgi:hypothetical protein